ncbi:hypothetical protein Sphch_2518 [Sphingobium chlorophenolicum L-1]|uniref:Secreted protein n=1 Tax=Sphingobium chlorophenolicum L-1 TaxID=690566 RepID=F6EZ76_SPHCR|nr:hypothetical protein Sphch_2518 [Sphingobium chlorophenolicum L-1]
MIQRLRAVRPSQMHHYLSTTASPAVVSLLMAAPAHASGSSMPWEAPLQGSEVPGFGDTCDRAVNARQRYIAPASPAHRSRFPSAAYTASCS